MLKHFRASETKAFIKELYNVGQNASLVDVKKRFGDLTFNIIVRMVVGKRYFGAESNAADAEEALQCQQGIRDFFHYIGLFVVSDAFPSLEGLDLQGYEKGMKRTAKNLDSIVEGWLKEHKQKGLAADYDKAKSDQDFMDAMISMMENSKLDDYVADRIIKVTRQTNVSWDFFCSSSFVLGSGSHLLHGFEFAAPSGEPVDMTESRGLTNMKATSLEVLLSPRLPPKLYR
ncbi:hypothetical protein NE237_007342 [Protea cynaroides]|uniref:Uncharacterized protein n=1 Tax=Protea cynaroides TaxID=273540 RepID=A0A9Q0KP43_9MAGN|nr:hypothetical protein NE237_007342 [Protea cynaroides]